MIDVWAILAVAMAVILCICLVGIVRPQAMGGQSRGGAFGGAIVSAIVLGFALLMLDPLDSAGEVAAKRAEAAKDPATYAAYLMGPNRSVKAERNGNELRVSYSLDSVSAAHAVDDFLYHGMEIFPALFDQFPDLRLIELKAFATLVTKRGQESVDEVAWIQFGRDNAATIKWDNILHKNLPEIADRSWFHPALTRP